MAHKNDYSVTVYFDNCTPKKLSFVNKLDGFAKFLDEKYSTWKYFNVYERKTAKFLSNKQEWNSNPLKIKMTKTQLSNKEAKSIRDHMFV